MVQNPRGGKLELLEGEREYEYPKLLKLWLRKDGEQENLEAEADAMQHRAFESKLRSYYCKCCVKPLESFKWK